MIRKIILLIFALAFPAVTYANMVWPSLYLETRLFTWWAITLGLVVEYLFVRKLFEVPITKAIIGTFLANLLSAVAGIILIPLSGIVWELTLGAIVMLITGHGTFNIYAWIGSMLFACIVNVLLEGIVYKYYFKGKFYFKSKKFWWFVLANAISVGVALLSIIINPMQL